MKITHKLYWNGKHREAEGTQAMALVEVSRFAAWLHGEYMPTWEELANAAGGDGLEIHESCGRPDGGWQSGVVARVELWVDGRVWEAVRMLPREAFGEPLDPDAIAESMRESMERADESLRQALHEAADKSRGGA